ncbi:MAG: hypothetical protein ACRDWV_00370 [Acidimicrobiales bacterium]
MASKEFQWFDRSQPQTLQYGVILLYVDAVFLLLFGLQLRGLLLYLGIALAVAQAVGGFGTASERKWGYFLGVAAAIGALAFAFYITFIAVDTLYVLNLIFDGALVALLLHPQSRDYQRIWFK